MKYVNLFHATDHFVYPLSKAVGFLMFSGSIERDQWHEIGEGEFKNEYGIVSDNNNNNNNNNDNNNNNNNGTERLEY